MLPTITQASVSILRTVQTAYCVDSFNADPAERITAVPPAAKVAVPVDRFMKFTWSPIANATDEFAGMVIVCAATLLRVTSLPTSAVPIVYAVPVCAATATRLFAMIFIFAAVSVSPGVKLGRSAMMLLC